MSAGSSGTPSRTLNVLITGANSGIGLRAAERLAADGHRVHALCRSRERGEAALRRINAVAKSPARLLVADLSDQDSIRSAVGRLGDDLERLDVLVDNGALFDQRIREARFTSDGHELFWATNHLGPFLLTATLGPLLAAAPRPRVINVASKGLVAMPWIRIRFDDLDSPSWFGPTKAYYHAKLAQIMTSFELALRTAGRLDVACIAVPSVRLDTDRLSASRLLRALYAPKRRMAMPPERLAETYARIATRTASWTEYADPGGDERARLRGIYLDEEERPVTAPRSAYERAARERLWDLSGRACGDPPWAW